MTTVLSKRRIQYYNRDDHAIAATAAAAAAATEDIISLVDSPTSSSSSVVHDTSTKIDVDLMNGNNNLNNIAVALPGATRNNTNGRKNNL